MHPKQVAEGEGFEPSVRVLIVRPFSKRLVSASHPSLLIFCNNSFAQKIFTIFSSLSYLLPLGRRQHRSLIHYSKGEGSEASVRVLIVRPFSKRLVSASHPSLLIFCNNSFAQKIFTIFSSLSYLLPLGRRQHRSLIHYSKGEGSEASVRVLIVRPFSKRLVSASHPSLLIFCNNSFAQKIFTIFSSLSYLLPLGRRQHRSLIHYSKGEGSEASVRVLIVRPFSKRLVSASHPSLLIFCNNSFAQKIFTIFSSLSYLLPLGRRQHRSLIHYSMREGKESRTLCFQFLRKPKRCYSLS